MKAHRLVITIAAGACAAAFLREHTLGVETA